jgi:hypothetical protein
MMRRPAAGLVRRSDRQQPRGRGVRDAGRRKARRPSIACQAIADRHDPDAGEHRRNQPGAGMQAIQQG